MPEDVLVDSEAMCLRLTLAGISKPQEEDTVGQQGLLLLPPLLAMYVV